MTAPPSDLCDEMRHAVIALGGPRGCGETMDRVFERAALAADISVRAAKALFYREARNPAARVVDNIRAAMERREAASARRAALLEETARAKARHAHEDASRSLDAAIHVSDADEICALLVRVLERLDRVRGQGGAMAPQPQDDERGLK